MEAGLFLLLSLGMCYILNHPPTQESQHRVLAPTMTSFEDWTLMEVIKIK